MNQKRNLSDLEMEELLQQMDADMHNPSSPSSLHEDTKLLLAAGENLAKTIDTEQAWKEFKKKHYSNRKRKTILYCIGAIAASALLCIVIGNAIIRHDTPQMVDLYERTNAPAYIQIEYNSHVQQIGGKDSILNFWGKDERYNLCISTPAGREIKVILPDSSTVRLNADSRLSYRKTAQKREVSLKGEAFFNVTHNTAYPFIIRSGNVVSQVLGTTFNIKHYQNESPHISLLRGSLKVYAPRQEKIMKPGDEVMVTKNGKISVKQIQTTDMAVWTKDEFLFDNMSVTEIVKEIGRYYNLNIKTLSPNIPDRYIHLRCSRRTDIQTIINMLNDICDLYIQKQDHTLIIHSDKNHIKAKTNRDK